MRKLFDKICRAGTGGLLFQAFVPLSDANGSNVAPTLSSFFTQSGPNALAGFFNAAFTMALSAGAILAVLRLAYAGWLYMSSDAFGKKSHAKEVITDAILGLLLLIGIWIILNQINPCLLNLNILQSIQGSSTCQSS